METSQHTAKREDAEKSNPSDIIRTQLTQSKIYILTFQVYDEKIPLFLKPG